MTIRIFLEQFNGYGAAIEGAPPPAVWLDLDDDRSRVRVGFDLDRHEYARNEKANEFEAEHARGKAYALRAHVLEAALEEHRGALRLAWRRHMERVARYKPGSANWIKAIRERDNLEVSQHEALWRLINSVDGASPNMAAYRSSVERDFYRDLTVDEAREVAAALLHYANETERPR